MVSAQSVPSASDTALQTELFVSSEAASYIYDLLVVGSNVRKVLSIIMFCRDN